MSIDTFPLPDASGPPAAEKRNPRRGSERRVRHQSIFLRVTDSEGREIEAAAELAGMEPGTYARHMALSDPHEAADGCYCTVRPTRLSFRVSAEERTEIEARADQAGLTVGSFVRARALRQSVTLAARRRVTIDQKELSQLLQRIGLAGSNVNQIARQLNSGGDVEDEAIGSALSDIRGAARAIMRVIGKQLDE